MPFTLLLSIPPLSATAENAALHLQLSSSSEQQQIEVGELQSELAVMRFQLTDQQTQFEEVRRERGCACVCLFRKFEWYRMPWIVCCSPHFTSPSPSPTPFLR